MCRIKTQFCVFRASGTTDEHKDIQSHDRDLTWGMISAVGIPPSGVKLIGTEKLETIS